MVLSPDMIIELSHMVFCFFIQSGIGDRESQIAVRLLPNNVTRTYWYRSANMAMFQGLCGPECMTNVLLVTTMWNHVRDEATGNGRLNALSEGPWKPLLGQGARSVRYRNTYDSALQVVNMLASRTPIPLQIQVELVDRRMKLRETAAGLQIDADLKSRLASHEEAAAELKRRIKQLRRSGGASRMNGHKPKARDKGWEHTPLAGTWWKDLGGRVFNAWLG